MTEKKPQWRVSDKSLLEMKAVFEYPDGFGEVDMRRDYWFISNLFDAVLEVRHAIEKENN